jgi:inhibitor of KinA
LKNEANEEPRIRPAGDSTLLVEFAERIDVTINTRAIALAEAIAAKRVSGVRDVAPAFRSVSIHFDPLRTDLGRLADEIRDTMAQQVTRDARVRAAVRIPVCYGGPFGPDLSAVAAWSGMTEEEVVLAHTRTKYQVFMLGFLPGFPYLASVDAAIAMPRRETPRTRVARGSVGIAGHQTGIYPQETPGGWQIIGRTPVQLFNGSKPEAPLLKPGDQVEFHRVSANEFDSARETIEAAS